MKTPVVPGIAPGDDIAVIRNEGEKKTYYELRFTAEELQAKGKKNSVQEISLVSVSVLMMVIKPLDKGGQKGWSGWYTHSIVFGKNSEKTGLVTLTDEVLAVEAANKLTTTWGKLKSTQ